jgi:hypothetical protein
MELFIMSLFYFLIAFVIFWVSYLVVDEFVISLSIGVFWPIWIIVGLIKLVIKTIQYIKEVF